MRRVNQPAVKARPPRQRVTRTAPDRRDSLLDLQSSAGNRAVAWLVTGGALLRKDEPPPEPRKTPGWDAPIRKGKRLEIPEGDPDVVGGWNLSHHLRGQIWRVPVQDLKLGNQAAFAETVEQWDEKTKSYKTVKTAEHQKTLESAAGRAIVLVHKNLTLGPEKEVSVLLHLHGWGWRRGDPFPGWRERDKKVRDIAQDRIAEQIEAAQNPQIIGILPQGVGTSYFGNLSSNAQAYIDEVLDRTVAVSKGTGIPVTEKPKWKLVLSAHSGGGGSVARMLGGGVKPAEVVLFDAINGKSDLKAVGDWADAQLNSVLGAPPDKRGDAVASCPVLRAYASEKSGYPKRYLKLKNRIDGWFATNGDKLGPHQDAVRARFKVGVVKGAEHETVVSGLDAPAAGPLADALRAIDRPTEPGLLDRPEAKLEPGKKRKASPRVRSR
jgi:hypothetical protein